MALNSSQESLPLSQETYLQLFNELNGIPLDHLMSEAEAIPLVEEENNYLLTEGIKAENDIYSSTAVPNMPLMEQNTYENVDCKRPVSSLPASENWPGVFDFKVSFPNQQQHKGMTWIYSHQRNKLYVGKDVPCPVNFSTNTIMPDDVIIRAMPLFSSSDHANDNVKRCVNHSMEELKQNIPEAEFFVRCDSRDVVYEINPVTERHSVIIPFENPAVGSTYSTYLFKFMCFGSCSGGPNRRPLMIIFTLERGEQVLGRQRVDLKVCACPARDFKTEEKQDMIKENQPPASTQNHSRKHQIDSILPESKKVKVDAKANVGDRYILETQDKGCFNFLKKMKRLYEIQKMVKSNPNLRSIINISSQSSCSSGEEKD